MKTVQMWLFMGLAMGLLAAAPAWADPHDGYGEGGEHGMMHGGPGMGPMAIDHLQKELGLSDDQTAKLKTLREDYLKQTITQGAKVKVAGVELMQLLDQPKPDMATIEKKVREREALQSDLTLSRISYLLKARDFLTPEQYKKFRELTMERMEAAHEQMPMHPMMKGGPSAHP